MPPIPRSSDTQWMARALSLAREVRVHVWPNPPVGCVVVRDGLIVAKAATLPGGRPHAERMALDLAGRSARGATLHVTLEPCCHWGKTPPCIDAIIDSGVMRVVCAVQVPDSRVDGGGFAKLGGAGVDVAIGLGAREAQAVMSGFLHRVQTGAPEMVRCDHAIHEIPDGVDAVLASKGPGVVLATRQGGKKHLARPGDDLRRWMGKLGLTTVAIPEGNPLWKEGVAAQTGRLREGEPDAVLLSSGAET